MSFRFLFLSLLGLLFPLSLGCDVGVGSLPGFSGGPTPVVLRSTPVPEHPFVPGLHRYVEAGDRLVIPTFTPQPTPTPRVFPTLVPTPTLEPVFSPGPRGVGSGAGSHLSGNALPSCTGVYREMLLEYRGRIPFSSQVARGLAEGLREDRPDCVEAGWAPELEADRVCILPHVAGVRLSRGLTWQRHSMADPRAVPTARDSSGSMLVHFARMPLVDARGCWYYHSPTREWAWLVSGSGSGVDRPRFPSCDGLLQELLSTLEAFGQIHVVRAIDEVRLQLPEECGTSLWSLFPSSGFHEDCGVAGNTGVNPEGFLVVSWQEEHLPWDNAVCWVLPEGSDVWEYYYVQEAVE